MEQTAQEDRRDNLLDFDLGLDFGFDFGLDNLEADDFFLDFDDGFELW